MSVRQLFRESYNINIKPQNIEVLDKPKLVESQGKQFEAIVVLRNVPVSKYTENLNNRIYRKSLWERVKSLNEFEGIPAFDSHLENPKPTDMLGVWHNFRIGESTPFADFYIIDERIARAVKAGIRTLGISTSGYGELAEDGKTVRDESFQIISSDVVWQPSQQVYLSQEQLDDNDNVKTESVNQSNKINETLTNTTIMEDVTVGNEFLIKQQLKQLAKTANQALKEGVESSLIKVREDINSYIEDPALPKGFEESVSKLKGLVEQIDDTIGAKLEETKKSLQETTEKSSTLSQENAMLKKSLEEMKSKIVKADTLIKELQSGSKITEAMQSDIDLFAEERKVIEFDMTLLKKDFSLVHHDLKEAMRVIKAQEADMRRLMADIKLRDSDLKEAMRAIKILESDREIAIKKLKEAEEPATTGETYADVTSGEEFDRLNAETQDIAIDPAIEAKEKGEGYSESNTKARVKAFYLEAVEEYPYIKHHKDKILAQESIISASRVINTIVESQKKDVGITLRESSKKVGNAYHGRLL